MNRDIGPSRTSGAFRAAALVALTVTLPLTGCSAVGDLFGGGDDEPERGENGQVSEVVEGADVYTVEVGDCLGEFGDGVVNTVDIYPCDQEHHQQVFSITQIDAAEFPDEEALTDLAAEDCFPAFEEFVGVAYEESELEIDFLAPSQESWDQEDDRELVCTVYDPSAPVTGSLQDAAR